MNEFGRVALAAWQELAPAAVARLTNPRGFFQDLGRQAQQAWLELTLELLEPDQPGEDYFSKVGRVQAAKLTAREIVIADWCRPPQDLIDGEPTID